VRILLLNTDRSEPFEIAAGDRIAQLVIVDLPDVEFTETPELTDTARGGAGFGSSGVG
jgi:dUTP pyrophosphatase